jgi:DnaJ family protein C protein 28
MSILHKGEDQIRKAIEEGQFDNLPGKGKPLNLDENPLEDPELRLAHKTLHEGGYTLPWIEKGQEIDDRLEKGRQSLRRAWLWRQEPHQNLGAADAEWKRAEARFREEIGVINELIFRYNLEAPLLQLQRFPLNVEKEVLKITG